MQIDKGRKGESALDQKSKTGVGSLILSESKYGQGTDG
jgi:hypothetical protein